MLNEVQFHYDRLDTGGSRAFHRIQAQVGGQNVGHMLWSSDSIRNVMVNPEHQRMGIATGMWNEGHRVAEQNARVPKPKHSPDRTRDGDAWAKKVGGPVPRARK